MIKIEKKALTASTKSSFDWKELCEAVADLKIGESFTIDGTSTSNVSGALTYIGYAMRRKFAIRREDDKTRVGRTA